MPKGLDICSILEPVRDTAIQAYFGQGLHSLGLLLWLLPQTGPADVYVSSYSTSEPFLNGFYLQRQKGMVKHAMILLDQRAARKTLKLEKLLDAAFDNVFMGQNHSKIMLIQGKDMKVSVITSQNQTYGARAESTIITTDRRVFDVLMKQFIEVCGKQSVEIDVKNGKGIISEDRGTGQGSDDTSADWRPFGAEW